MEPGHHERARGHTDDNTHLEGAVAGGSGAQERAHTDACCRTPASHAILKRRQPCTRHNAPRVGDASSNDC